MHGTADALGSGPGRVIGTLVGERAGPTLILIGGVHGNEPAGVRALERVFGALTPRGVPLRGEAVGVVGNRAALEAGERYLVRDLNRAWHPERVAALRQKGAAEGEDREQLELLDVLEAGFARARGPVYVVDLHTTSSAGPPFATIDDAPRNRAFGRRFPLPLVLGLEERLDGTLLDYLAALGHVTLGVEGGQNDLPDSVDNLEAAAWIALVAAGLVSARALAEYRIAHERLRTCCRGIPPVLEVCYRHPVAPEDAFRMEPGYEHFRPIRQGEVLARCQTGEVRAVEGGRILMPLYQELGNDGFFLVRQVAPLWLQLTDFLRLFRVEALASWLPAVRRHPTRADAVVVRRPEARRRTVRLLRFLGFRREGATGDEVVMSRREGRR